MKKGLITFAIIAAVVLGGFFWIKGVYNKTIALVQMIYNIIKAFMLDLARFFVKAKKARMIALFAWSLCDKLGRELIKI